MNEQPKMGMNRTGVQMSPIDTNQMLDASTMMPVTPGDESAIADLRSSYIVEADQVGSVPPPGTVKGVLSTGVSMLTGNNPNLLLDKLGERLAFERTGTRLYEALITKVQSLERTGTMTVSVEKLMQIRDEEARHFALIAEAIRSLGGDPTAQTPCADLVGVESMGLMQALTDPRTTVSQSLHAIMVAEMTDNNGWEMLIALAQEQNHDQLVHSFNTALSHEREHLQQVQSWLEQAMLGAPIIH
ncbi:MAG: ferritin-like domain-containing protein [Pseudomonadota bacterium]